MRKHIRAALLPTALLSAAFLLASCLSAPTTSENDSNDGIESNATIADTLPAETTYTVTVHRTDGVAIDNMIVKLFRGEEQIAMKPTGGKTSVSFTLPTDNYDVVLEPYSSGKFYYAHTTLTAEASEATIELCNDLGEPFQISAPSKNGGDGYVNMDAYALVEGKTHVTLNDKDHTYLTFNPTRAGYYEFTCSAGVDFAYHGMPILIYNSPRIEPTDGVITIPVEASSLGEAAISNLVFRLNPAEGEAVTEAFFTVRYTGELKKSEEELAEWTIIKADEKALVPYEGDTSGTLTDVDVTDPTVKVVLGKDGYYHYGTADGPVVFLRISSPNKYTQSFKEMCETDRIRAFFYDENDKFLRKEGYSEMVLEYAEVASEAGLVPLNDQLIYMLENAGRYMGWWNFEQNRDIFGDDIVDKKVAWLFACAYYA